MLRRKVEKEILSWMQTGQKALLIYGVRQAGKTYVIRKCLNEANCNYVEFNLIQQPEILEILENTNSVQDIILKLSLYSNKKLIHGETYIFLDEIQMCKEFVTKLKFLVEDGRFKYVLSGSLLGVEIINLKSAPVGYLQTLTMYPLDFEEFLQVFHVSDDILSVLKKSYEDGISVDETIHKKMMDIFQLYLIIGGMPAAVAKYQSTGNIDEVMAEHADIVELYKLDFTKYEAEDRKLLLTHIYEMIPAEINEKNKRFKIADINKNLRYDRIQDSFTWLWKAGVALPIYNSSEPVIPLLLNEKSTLFKLFLSDVGMLTSIYGKATKLKIVNQENDINKGSIYENVVAQELIAHGYPLYYYNNKKWGEIDFVIEHGENILPIEVKSGKNYEKHSALKHLMNEENYVIPKAIVFSNENIKQVNHILYLPIYMIMFLKREEIDFADISVEKFSF